MNSVPGAILSVDQIRQDLQSPRQEIRVRAMQALLLAVQRDGSLLSAAMPIFQQSIRTEQDPSTAIYAVRGIKVLAGPDEARTAWLTLLTHPNPKMVAGAARAIDDPCLAPILMELADRRPELPIRISAVRTLGRLKDPFTLPVLLKSLDDPELRQHAAEALGEFGAPEAIPSLQHLFQDTTPAWEEDNHGPMLRVCDLAGRAVARLRNPPRPIATTKHTPPPPMPRARPKVIVAAYMPLIAAVVEAPWIGITIVAQLVRTGKFDPTPTETHWLAIIMVIPSLIGVAIGIFVLLRGGIQRWFDRIFLLLGSIACGLFIFSFSWDFFHHL